MTSNTPHTRAGARETRENGFLARSRKALVAGIVGAAGGVTSTLPGAAADGHVNGPEIAVVATAAVVGFVLGFATVWATPNAG